MAIIEGPIVTVICGFLVTLGIMNPLFVYAIVVLGDTIGDITQYYLGYFGKTLAPFFPFLKITEEKLERAKVFFNENHTKSIILSKLIYGVGFTGIIVAGAAHIPFRRYIKTSMIVSAIQSAVMLTIGMLFGRAYEVIGKYLDFYAAGASVVALIVLLIIIIRKYKFGLKKTL
jgi:membrane protein DedA with SNARE-associated domain